MDHSLFTIFVNNWLKINWVFIVFKIIYFIYLSMFAVYMNDCCFAF